MSTIITVSTTSNTNTSSTLKVGDMYYTFNSPAAKRQVVRRIRQGYDVGETLRWAMGLGQDPLYIQQIQVPEPVEIESAEYESQQVGGVDSSYEAIDFDLEDAQSHKWLWENIYKFHENGWVKPTLSKVYKNFQYLVDIFWDVLGRVPLGTDMKRSYDIATAIYQSCVAVSPEAVDLLIKYWEVLLDEKYLMDDVVRSLELMHHIHPLSPEVKEVVIHNGCRWRSYFSIEEGWYDFIKEESISIFDVLTTLDKAFNHPLESINNGWLTLILWYVRAKEMPSDTVGVKSQFYGYSTDIITLATSKKQEEVKVGNKLMFGVELEFSHSNYSLKELFGLTQMGVFKYDSSVDGEYVTLPYTPEELISKIETLSSSFNKLLSANGSEGNGMHVHISKDVLTYEQVLNIQNLLNPQDDWGKDCLEAIADRDIRNNQYCGFIPARRYNSNELYTTSRYTVLNLQNEHTIEVRMFKSPSDVEGVIANLMFVMAIVEVSKYSNSLLDLKEYLDNV